jgi:uncharacterized NAD(P)/FAD-binding protein YdhS
MITKVQDKYDLVFIGGGIATTASLLKCLDALIINSLKGSPISILVIEKDDELWKGQPYGNRSMPNALTITTLEEFIPICQKEEFYNWLYENRAIWLEKLLSKGGPTATKWVERNKLAIDNFHWDKLFIPRFLFGDFLEEKLLDKILFAETNNLAHVFTLKGEVVDVEKHNESFKIDVVLDFAERISTQSKKVFLAIGSPKIKKINNLPHNKSFHYINDTYSPSIESNLEAIDKILVSNVEKGYFCNILLVGSNASSIEFLYLLNSYKSVKHNVNKIMVMSPSGRLPNRISHDAVQIYDFENLSSLLSASYFSPSVLFETIKIDLEIAYAKGIRLGDMYYQINDLVVSLLNKLTEKDKESFHCNYGMIYSKLIRRSGADYSNGVDSLFESNKLKVVRGSFQHLIESKDSDSSVNVSYLDEQHNVQVSKDSFSIVINCGGFEDLQNSTSELIYGLIKKGICKVNCTKKGIKVNEDFEAIDNFYVIGPLLGGIFNNKVRLWHVENAKSIFRIATLMTESFVN